MSKLCIDCKHYRGSGPEYQGYRKTFHYCERGLKVETDPVTGKEYISGRKQSYEERNNVTDGINMYCGPTGQFWEPRTAEQLIEDKRRRDEREELERKIEEQEKLRSRGFWGFFGGR